MKYPLERLYGKFTSPSHRKWTDGYEGGVLAHLFQRNMRFGRSLSYKW
jgi:hypothetical protein